MTTLSIDTSTELLAVALETADGGFFELNAIAGFEHVQRLVPTVQILLESAGIEPGSIDLVVCSRGPGSFTGLRIGMATAKGIAFAASCPVVSVPTLDVFAYPLRHHRGPVIPILDARKKRVYCAVFEDGERTSDYLDVPINAVTAFYDSQLPPLITGISIEVLNAAALVLPNALVAACTKRGHGDALITLGTEAYARGEIDGPDAGPMYLRKSDAELGHTR